MKDTTPRLDSALILVVDDDKLMRLQLRRAMEQAGYQVVEANDGEQALAAYTRYHPDIVLLNAILPVMDGFICCRQLQKLPGGDRTPILMITVEERESIELAFEAGAADFITKPIHWAVLDQRVRRLLQTSRTMEELRQQTERSQLGEERLRLALDAAGIGTWDWDILTNKMIYSHNLRAIFGLPRGCEHPTYEAFLHAVHPEDCELVERAMLRAVEEGAEYSVEFRVISPDGTVHWTASQGQVYYDETGKPLRMAGISADITERKQAEEELQRSEEFLRRIIKSSPDCIKVLDLEGRLLYMSAAGQSLLEIDNFSSVINSQWVDFWQEIYHQAARSALETAKAAGIGKFQGYCPTAKGTPKWWEVVVTPLLDAEGKPEKLLSVSRDITERKQAEEQLQQTMVLQRAILESANYAIISTSVDGTILTFNTAAERWLGYAAAEIVGKTTPIMIHDWDEVVRRSQELSQELGIPIEPGFEAFVAKARRGEPDEHEWSYIRKDGSRFPLLLSVTRLVDAQGNITGFLGIGSDITDRKQAEEELQRQNLRSQLFSEITLKIRQSLQLNEILQTTVNEIQKFLQANRVLIFRLWPNGYGQIITEAVVPGCPSVLGRGITDDCFGAEYLKKYSQGRIYTIADIEQAEIEHCLIEFMQQFGVKAKLVMPILLKEELWGLLIAHQCDRPRNWSSFEINLLRQIADQIGIALAQAQLLAEETRQRQELARSNAELQQFASVASHDLQEPLRKIQAFGNRLKAICGEALTDQGRDYLERMQNAAQRMQALIDDLLILSRITTRGQPFVSVDLAQVAQEVLSDLELQLQQTQGRVEVRALPTIEADPLQMRQLLQNLLSNALKFHRHEEAPVVKLCSQLLDQNNQPVENAAIAEFCQIIVEDNGIGFDEKYLDRIFNVFQRLHSRSEYEGTGMGLAICRKIAERHYGSITARSTLGQGATFIVTMPVKQRIGDNLE